MNLKKILTIGSILIFFFLSNFLLKAQDAKFRGTVKDEEGNPVPNAKITLTLIARNISISFKSNKKGKFFRRGIDPGRYLLTVEIEGYHTLKKEIRIKAGEELRMDIIVEKKISFENARNNFIKGIQFYRQKEYDKAIELFKMVLKDRPDLAECYYNLGLAYLYKGDIDNAIVNIDKAIELKPEFLEAYFALAHAYVNKKNEEKAIEIYKKAININPNNAKLYVNLGALYSSVEKDDLAIESLLKAKELEPTLPNTYYQFGLLYLRKGNIEKSIENFKKFLKLAPNAPEAQTVRTLLNELEKKIPKREFNLSF
ncbi:tetratricopeptide repeat protein [Candidatus Aminicenantes bacterium AC-335-A11]|jgi:tetratricopeptide (TPR) repeat protein|nr:tetratricopeptide repeat protein [SCandidatus Aminicenantes bacterium Aminicenantia_JdfR_composite]MCP2618405.1 tetratricopeptide repeat protein [Candidatus Aminicenantes bacterium AC-335-A11]MCP2620739.1 tetratricopeptide repeat protein [Candidatus Aminicenantes bacterium AC-334-E05]